MPDNNNTKFIHGRWRKTKTNSGLPKIVDRNGFAICHGKDYGKEADANFDLIAQAPAMYAAMQDFCDRVERGEVRSRKTYEQFKSILALAGGENQPQP